MRAVPGLGSSSPAAAYPNARPGLLQLATASPARVALVALLAGTLGLGLVGAGIARPLFVLGAAGVGYLAWREGAGRSVEIVVALYVFAPFLRRIVDAGIGFDPSSLMLVGPVLAVALPASELRDVLIRPRPGDSDLKPQILVVSCITYGMLISAFQGAIGEIATSSLKMYLPLLYGAWVMRQVRNDPTVLASLVQVFCFVTPIIGAYGIWQYFDPQDWDRFWMLSVSSSISVLGTPEPFKVRVFSMMNSPASFGTYAACGVLLFGFCRRGVVAVLCASIVSIGLLFTFYRTAWTSLVVGIAYCAVFRRSRQRAFMIATAIVVATVVAAGSSDFGQAIVDRLDTFTSSVSNDGSGKARLEQLAAVYESLDDMAFGWGWAALNKPFNGVDAADGEIVSAFITMGAFVGTLYLAGLLWAAIQALSRIGTRSDPEVIIIGAMILGMVLAVPLTGITSGEIGLLFWMFVGIATAQPARQHQPLSGPAFRG